MFLNNHRLQPMEKEQTLQGFNPILYLPNLQMGLKPRIAFGECPPAEAGGY